VKVDALKGDVVTAHALRDVVGDLADVASVDVSAATGSVLVEYEDGATTSRRLAELAGALAPLAPELDEDGIVDLLAAEPRDASHSMNAAGAVRAAMSGLNGGVAAVTGGTDLAVLVPAGLTALGAGALLFGEQVLLPEWYTLFWFAFGTWVALNAAAAQSSANAPTVETAPL
jgi:hypothetical protein